MKVVIVGGVAGGASAAARIRRLDDLQCQHLLSENRSLHLTIRPVFFAEKELHVPVEIQLRTIAMDFWASLEHTIRYKKNLPINAEIETELKECADSSREWDRQNGTSTAHLNIIRWI